MKVGEFQNAIHVNSKTYSNFMGQHGPEKGAGSTVYVAAWAFFKKRELRGIETKPNKKTKADAGKDGGKDAVPDVDDVELDGEKEDEVRVYGGYIAVLRLVVTNDRPDTCDEIRRKINAHLKKPGVTQSAFLRAASASFHKAPRKLTAAQLSAFRSKKSPYEGNMSGIFYAAYVYFEKLRIKQGKPKSQKRQEMEKIWAHEGGLDTKARMDRVLCFSGERPHLDSFGRVTFS
jgi:hypothetical protein